MRLNGKGFTLVEVMTAVLLLGLVWMAVPGSIVAYKYIASYSKHKVEAIYVAQRVIEETRREPFSNIGSFYEGVTLDDKNTFGTTADDYLGGADVTVTSLDPYRKRLQVRVEWFERTPIGIVIKNEYCTADISSDTQLN